MQQLQPNTTLQGGKYRIERVLGQGGFGNTYEGTNTIFDERVAIKEFFMQGINNRDGDTGSVSVSLEGNKQQFEEQREKFKKEALRIRKLNNPYIIKVHDLFEENGTAYYVMDYVDGENLAERLKRTGQPMTEQEVRMLLPQILDALRAVHDAGIWHLDLKPANIMVDKEGNVKLIDFGASKQFNAQKGGATTSTAISYTNGYAPREQMEQNYDKFGPWTDFYALGATLYTLLTNKRPPLPTDIDDDISEDKHLALPLPNSVSKEMKGYILWMMQTNRNRRPQNIDEFVSKMEEEAEAASVDEVKAETTIPSEETIIENSKYEETIIDAPPIVKPKLEPRQVVPQVKKESYTPTGGNNKKEKTQDQSNMKFGWLVFIAFFIILLIGGIHLYNSQSNNYSQSESSENTAVTDEEYVDSLADRDWIEINTPIGGCQYAGSFDDEKRPHGFGEAFFNDGRYYLGYFVHGDLAGDNACFKYPNGDVFKGSFKNNAFYEGTYTIAEDGSYFVGTYKNGQPDKGRWYDKNGKLLE